MKYPFHTESKPVVDLEAKTLLKIIQSNGAITNQASEATIKRILARRINRSNYEEKVKVRRD
ncbi:hypothetical protein PN36_26745 [Candidatus Thiomargarita nelsonii]|uniref:Uncharacterized protein n=1 Tax=Candidatus Thiomargarita nelsonii TaxID=1003181 RepID=A0A4E0QLV6_9GAMM|nr:hypothetical protein PN36_26745 [Candidatus Thiomargarita nelsonii]